MTRLDRYILRNLIVAFGFFVLVFTGVVWLSQAVRLIDTVLASGQGARVFLEFSALVLPQVFVIVVPLAGIGATLSAINRLYGDSEITVMMAAGAGPVALLRPVAVFGLILGACMALVMTVLVPRGGTVLADRTQAIRSDIAQALLVEREFLHPAPGLTLFISETGRAGEMAGIFLNDQRDRQRPVTYSAEHAYLLREGQEARLVMRDGVALSLGASSTQLSSVAFEQFVFDLTPLIETEGARVPRPSEYQVRDLLDPTPAMLASGKYTAGDFVAEGHYKIVMPLLALVLPMIALATLLAGGHRRSGFGRRVFVAIGVGVILQIMLFLARARIQVAPDLWPVVYLPIALGFAYVGALMQRMRRARRPTGLRA